MLFCCSATSKHVQDAQPDRRQPRDASDTIAATFPNPPALSSVLELEALSAELESGREEVTRQQLMLAKLREHIQQEDVKLQQQVQQQKQAVQDADGVLQELHKQIQVWVCVGTRCLPC